MASFLGSRFHLIFDRQHWQRMTLIHLIPFLLYFFGIAFNLSAAVTVAGMGLQQASIPACKGAMYVCLVFYCATKICVQLFLLERTHAVKKGIKKRINDPFWITFMGVVIVGFGTIAILAFLAPIGMVDEGDGQCRIGLPRKAVMILMTYDILINIILTGAFLCQLHPLFRMRADQPVLRTQTSLIPLRTMLTRPDFATTKFEPAGHAAGSDDSSSSANEQQQFRLDRVIDPNIDHLKALVKKSLFGAIVMMTATIINLALLYKYHGQEHGWICFMCCLIDVTWTVATIHLLTEGRKENRPSLVRHHSAPQQLRRDTWTQLAMERKAYSDGAHWQSVSDGSGSSLGR
ncbi:hypothetical protein KC320_g8913 [Hortaea werneckii]|nr:hypothetical protein KC320_g8913 [Hortaea werneckii]